VSEVPNNMRFTDSHEWIQPQEDGSVIVGITDYAQTSLGELVYVELPDVDDVIDADEDCAVIESVKAASDIYCPLKGQVLEVNEHLESNPGLVNESPYEKGWLFKMMPDHQDAADKLLDATEYRQIIAEEAH
jgi:glycine cleavage system H protein